MQQAAAAVVAAGVPCGRAGGSIVRWSERWVSCLRRGGGAGWAAGEVVGQALSATRGKRQRALRGWVGTAVGRRSSGGGDATKRTGAGKRRTEETEEREREGPPARHAPAHSRAKHHRRDAAAAPRAPGARARGGAAASRGAAVSSRRCWILAGLGREAGLGGRPIEAAVAGGVEGGSLDRLVL